MKRSIILLLIGILVYSCKNESNLLPVEDSSSSIEREIVALKSGIKVLKLGNRYFLEGDMELSPMQLMALQEQGSFENENKIPKENADTSMHPVYNIPLSKVRNPSHITPYNLGMNADPYRLWSMVRFTYGSSILSRPDSAFLKNKIRAALHQIENSTNVRFYNATGQPTVDPEWGFEYPYVEINYIGDASASSSSHIGRIPEGGKQTLSLADFAFEEDIFNPNVVHTITHELCHAIGMMHEQKRPDRDSYVKINWDNLTEEGEAQFEMVQTNYSYFGIYDIHSVMGYSSYTGSTDAVYDTNVDMYLTIDDEEINPSDTLTNSDRVWLNNYHLPYIARSDVYRELAETVYNPDNTVMTASERLLLQSQLNNGNPNPPAGGRIPNDF